MARHGRKFFEARKQIDREQLYDPVEAFKILKSVSYANFDETVEVHVRTGLDPRQADQQIRDVVVLPNGLGKQVVVLVFAQPKMLKLPAQLVLITLLTVTRWSTKF